MQDILPSFIQVGELADGFAPDSLAPPHSKELDGNNLLLCFDDNSAADCRFDSEGRAHVDIVRPGLASALAEVDGYHASNSLRPGVFFIDFRHGGDARLSLSLALDLGRQRCTLVSGSLPDAADVRLSAFERAERELEQSGVAVSFAHGAINRPATEAPPPGCGELVGMRNRYRYSPTECYEHIYLNDHFYAWHCLEGVEQGLADVDRCHGFQLAQGLYLFVWREKIIPTLGVLLIDLERMQTDGKIFGYQGRDFGASRSFRVGARASVVNVVPAQPAASAASRE